MKKFKNRLISGSLAVCLVSSLLAATSFAETAEEKGLAIAKKQKDRDIGWGDSQSEMKMILRTPNGKENTRMIKIKSLEVQTDGDKSLMVFDEPKDVAGTAFLSFSHIDTPDDQWIFLPALKRVKRKASKKKSGSFMGSEFSYEDMSSLKLTNTTSNICVMKTAIWVNVLLLKAFLKTNIRVIPAWFHG